MTAPAPDGRPWVNAGGYQARMGRSSFLIRCPFCGGESRTFIWSIAGGGKRCEVRGCDALFGSTGSAVLSPRRRKKGTPL